MVLAISPNGVEPYFTYFACRRRTRDAQPRFLLMGDDALRSTAPVATALCVVDKNERAIGPWLQIRALFRRESQLFFR